MKLLPYNVLFDGAGQAIAPHAVRKEVHSFGYNAAVQRIVSDSIDLGRDGEVFVRCTARILSNFKMTRSGPFRGVEMKADGSVHGRQILEACWQLIGSDLVEIRSAIATSGHSRDRYLLELSESQRIELVARIWSLTKQLLPLTMGQTSYGLVGASKILFAVLPEVVLPIDNRQWLGVFRTVDIGDVIHRMTSEIRAWESETREELNAIGGSGEPSTLPCVYNAMAMAARP